MVVSVEVTSGREGGTSLLYTARVTTRATVIDQVCSLLLFVQTFKDSVMRIKEKTMIYPPPPIKNSIDPLNTGKNLK